MNQKTKKLMTMHKALHSRTEIENVCVKKETGWDLASIEDSVDASIRLLEDYIKKSKGKVIIVVSNSSNNIKTKITKLGNKNLKKNNSVDISSVKLTRCHKIRAGHDHEKRNFQKETEFILIAVQSNSIRINYIKAKIDYTQQNSECSLRSDREKNFNQMINKFSKLIYIVLDWVGKWFTWNCARNWSFTTLPNGTCAN